MSKEHLNICMTANKFPILGRASDHGFLWPIAKGLTKRGHKVTIIASRSPLKKPEIIRDGVQVYYLQEASSHYAHMKFEDAVYEKFIDLHKKNPFDLVHSMDNCAYKIGSNKKKLHLKMAYDVEATQMSDLFSVLGMGQDNVTSLISTGINFVYRFLKTYLARDRKLLNTADAVFVTSPQQKIFLERYYLYPEYSTFTVPYGVELGDLSAKIDGEEEDPRKKYSINEDAKTLIVVNDMTDVKEMESLLEAFEKVAIKKQNTFMFLVGTGPNIKDVEYEVLSRALGNRVIMTGAIRPEEITNLIALSDVYVNMSSRSSGGEPTMIEAMAQKKIIIGSEMSPMASIIQDGQDGYLLRPADINSLANLLIEIFSGGVETAAMGELARAKVLNLFDTAKMIEAVEVSYRKILGDK